MRKQEDEKRDGDPEPSALDEEDVEQVIFAREVRGDRARVLHVRLRDAVVGRGADGGVEEREEGAEEEEDWVG